MLKGAMQRRQFLLAAASLAAPAVAAAQDFSSKPLIAYLTAGTRASRVELLGAFERGMKQLGLTQGRSYLLEARYAEGQFGRISALAQELLVLKPAVFLVSTTPANLVTKEAVKSTPIVMVAVADPVGIGLVESFSRPGGNITGVTNLTAELSGKRLETLRDLLPNTTRIAVLANLNDAGVPFQMRSVTAVANQLGIDLHPTLSIASADDIEPALIAAKRAGAGAALRMVDPLEASLRTRTIATAAKHKIPIMYAFREAVEAGGLISYGASQSDVYRQAASLVFKILNGATPAVLPVERPVTFELVINARTARELGIVIPRRLLVSAEMVD